MMEGNGAIAPDLTTSLQIVLVSPHITIAKKLLFVVAKMEVVLPAVEALVVRVVRDSKEELHFYKTIRITYTHLS